MPPTRTRRTDKWMVEIWKELHRGHIEERPLVHVKDKEVLYGFLDGQQITVNPVSSAVEILIHELLHRRFPMWSERYVRARTSELTSHLSHEEELELYKTYQQVAKKKKRAKVVD